MTEVTKTNVAKHSSGDQIKVTADLSDVQGSYTFTVPHLKSIHDWSFSPTTEVDFGATVSGNVITFATSTTIAGNVAVYGR